MYADIHILSSKLVSDEMETTIGSGVFPHHHLAPDLRWGEMWDGTHKPSVPLCKKIMAVGEPRFLDKL